MYVPCGELFGLFWLLGFCEVEEKCLLWLYIGFVWVLERSAKEGKWNWFAVSVFWVCKSILTFDFEVWTSLYANARCLVSYIFQKKFYGNEDGYQLYGVRAKDACYLLAGNNNGSCNFIYLFGFNFQFSFLISN